MKISKAFVTQFNLFLGQIVTFNYEHDKLWSDWSKVTGFEVHVDMTGEFTECKLFLKDISSGKEHYPISITNVYTKKEVEEILDKIVPLVYTIEAGKIALDYVDPIMKEYLKIKKLLEIYPKDKEEISGPPIS